MSKLYPFVKKCAQACAFKKYFLAIISCVILQQAHAQLATVACNGSNVTFTAPALAGSTTVTWWSTNDASHNFKLATGQSYTTPAVGTSYAVYYNYDNSQAYRTANIYMPNDTATFTTTLPSFAGCAAQAMNFTGHSLPSKTFLNCSGADGAGKTGSFPTSATDNISIEANVYWSNKGNTVTQYIMYNGNPGFNGYGILLKANTNTFSILLGGVAELATNIEAEGNKWAHIAAVRNNGVWTFYYNGVASTPANSTAAPNAPFGASAGFFVGNWQNQQYFYGYIDNAAIWTKALSLDDIANYRVNDFYPQTGLAGAWMFNETDGSTTLQDASGNGYNLTMNNASDRGAYNAGYAWNFAGTTGSAAVSPSFTFTSGGIKAVNLQVTDINGCSTSASQNVAINTSAMPAFTATSSTNNICGAITPINLGTTGGSGEVLAQGFTTNPPGTWAQTGSWALSVPYGSSGPAVYSPQTSYGEAVQQTLTSPAFNTLGASVYSITLVHYFSGNIVITGKLQISTDKTNWTDLASFTSVHGSPNNFETDIIAVPAAFINKSNVYLQFNYNDQVGSPVSNWYISSLDVYPNYGKPIFSWTSDVGGFTSSLQNPTGVTPQATTTYTLAENNGCGNTTSSVQVTVKPTSTATISVNNSVACSNGTPAVITFTGAQGSAPYRFVYSINGVVQSPVTSGSLTTATVSAPTSALGTFTYALDSVAGANGCEQSQSGNVNVVVNPLPAATMNIRSPVCMNDTANLIFKGANGTAPYKIGYSVSTVPGTNYATTDANGSSIIPLGTTISGSYSFGLLNVTDANGCSQTLTGTAPFVINTNPQIFFNNPSSLLFCKDSITLNVVGATTYSWEPATGLNHATGSSVKAGPPTTTKYVVTGTQNGCSATAAQLVTSAVISLAVPRDTVMCDGGTLKLASSGSTAATVFQEGFNTTLSGWVFQNNSTGGLNPAAAAWKFLLHFRPANSSNTLSFYRSSSEDQNGGTTLTTMQSPAFSTMGYSNMQVRLIDRLYAAISGGIYITNGIVQFSTDGANWTDVLTRSSGIPVSNFDTTTFTVPAAFENQPTVYLRFSYKATNSPGWWGIDDILITAVKPQTSFAWVSLPSGYTSSLQNPGNVSPASSTIYTVSTNNSAGCTATASVKDSIVVVPVFTVSAPVIAPANLSFNMSYNVSKGHPNKYSIVAAPGGLAGFTNINDATLTSSPITVNTPVHGPGTYNFYVTMRDATLSCAQSQQVTLPLSVLNNNNDLSALSISTGTLSPSFNAATTSYTVTEALGVSSVTVTPTIAASNAKGATVNGIAIASGSTSQSIPLTNAATIISIVVTAQDNSTKTYTITVTSPANINLVPVTTDAAVAYSLRKLSTTYLHAAVTPPAAVTGFTNSTTPLVRVQRASDNGQLDIGYTANGDIDTAILKSFAGAGDAFVTIWYDQSGNNRDASQSTAASQPRIVHAGLVERKNGRPTVYFYGSALNNVYLSTPSFIGFNTAFSAFVATGVKTDNGSNGMIAKTNGALAAPWDIYTNGYFIGDGTNYDFITMPVLFNASQPFAIWNFGGQQNTTSNIYLNGDVKGSITPSSYGDANVPLKLGTRGEGATRLDGWISEALVFPAIISETDRVAVTGNETSAYLSPYIASFSPASAAGGTVTIKGSSFTGTTAVSFGGTAASFTVIDDNTITATLAGGATGNVVVTNPWGSATKSGFFYGAPPDNAIKLNGTNQYATANTGSDAVTDKFTVEAWVKAAQPAAVSTIFSTRSGADNSFDMKLQGGNTIHGDIGDGSSWITTSADASFSYTTGRWYHIAYVVTTTGYTIYANGKAVGSGTFGAGHPLLYNVTHTATIGTYAATGEYFGGDIDEVRVYNDALTQAQVQADMQGTPIALPNNLMLYCNFGQASGASITDFGINNYTVTTTASPTFEESYAMVIPVVKPATNISDVSFTANWQGAQTGTVDKYLLDVATDAGFTNIVTGYNALAVTGITQQVTGLSQHTAYYYRVRAEKASVTGQGAYSDTVVVTTPYSVPVITNFDAVTSDVNTNVQIQGSHLDNAISVTFGGVTASVVSNNGSIIYATVPSANASGAVAVTTLGGTALKGGFYAGNPPANALYFDGVDDNVTLPSATINNLTNATYEVWVNPAGLRGTILSKQKNGVATNSVLSIGYYASAVGTAAEGTPGIVYFRSQNGKPLLASNIALQTGHWYHIAIVFNTTQASVYINGQLDNTVTGDFSIPDISGAITSLGAWAGDGGGQYFNGEMDELRIYGSDRSSSLSTDMAFFASSTGNGISSYYTFDAGTPGSDNAGNTVLYDLTPNSYNGTLNNFALNGSSSNWVESYAMVIPVAGQPTSISGNKFVANWSLPFSGTIDKFIVEVSTDSSFSTFTQYASLFGNSTNTSITGLQPNTKYYYRVRAEKSSLTGQGAYSAIMYATTLGPSVWTGATSTAWNTVTNWSNNVIPGTADDVTIPLAPANQPKITTLASVHNITLTGKLTVTGRLNISGDVTSSGTFDATAGSITFNGTTTQTIAGAITVNNLTVNNTAGVTLFSGITRVLGVYTPTAGVLTSNGHLTLASTSSGTAAVANAGSNSDYVTGDVTVERYIPGHRAWRMLTAPLSQTGTIYNNWQNAGTADGLTGAEMFRPGGGNGFDAAGKATSIRTYDEIADNWADLANTNATSIGNNNASAANKAFAVFITGPYGDKPHITSGSAATTLKATGLLQTGTQAFGYSAPVNHYILTGNPYASPVELTGVVNNAAGISQQFWVWDANRNGTSLGGYVTFTKVGSSYISDMSAGQSQQTTVLQSGEAFFTQASSATQSISFNENDKADISNSTNGVFFAPTPASISLLRIALNRGINNTMQPVDGVVAIYNSSYSKDASDDAAKLFNYDENLSIRSGSNYAAIQKAPLPVTGDSMWLDVYAMKAKANYSFTFTPQDMPATVQAYIVDNYLGTSTPLDLTQTATISFETGTDKASYAETRFVVVFAKQGTLATVVTTLKAWPLAKGIQVEWQTATEQGIQQYQAERSADGQTFTKMGTAVQPRNSNNTETYNITDQQPNAGDNYYRIKVQSKDGTAIYSNVVLIKMQKGKASINVYPNPVIRKQQLHLTLQNMAAGKYTLQLFGSDGKQLMQRTMQYDGQTTTQQLNLPLSIAAGSYRLVLLDEKGNEWKQQVVVQ